MLLRPQQDVETTISPQDGTSNIQTQCSLDVHNMVLKVGCKHTKVGQKCIHCK